ncbi:MAG: hypothetical protein D6713_08365 [Deltaproteobacteria bacterium]|nr:MAG: hypothetical protein D6713_08365 [Deltaproteobacteria bacterium]
MYRKMRKSTLFVAACIFVSVALLCLSTVTKEAAAAMMASKLSSATSTLRHQDLEKIKTFLEKKVVLQKLQDFGMTKEEALQKVEKMESQDLHLLASVVDSAPAGGDALGVAIGLAVLAILVIIILKLLNKEIIIK